MRLIISSLFILGTMIFVAQCGVQAPSGSTGPTTPAVETSVPVPTLTPTPKAAAPDPAYASMPEQVVGRLDK